MKIRQSLAALAAVLLASTPAVAQCDPPGTSIAVSTTGTFTNTCTFNAVSNHWDVTVTLNGAVTNNSNITIRGTNTTMLGKVVIQNNTILDCRVYILGSGLDQRIGGVGYLSKGTSAANKVILLQLQTAGDVGYDKPANAAIIMDSIYNLNIAGNVLGDMVSVAPNRSMGNILIGGDLRGGVSLGSTSSLDTLTVLGTIGDMAGPPVSFSIPGNIGTLVAGQINADITTVVNGSAGTVHHFETTSGDFMGSLTCHRLFTVAGAAGPTTMLIAGNLSASFQLTRDIRCPIYVGGSFTSTRPIFGGGFTGNVINAGTGFFDDPNAPAASSMHVVGDFAGAMSCGTPLSAGLGSINRDITIDGSFFGGLVASQDVNAALTVNGGLSGGTLVTGSLRAGKTISVGGPLSGTISLGSSLLGTISVPAAGLTGQTIVNANNAGGTWTGSIVVGGNTPLTNVPYYTNTSSDVGGGAVGLAPFRLYGADCTPPHDSPNAADHVGASTFTNVANNPVMIRCYGPVMPGGGGALTLDQAIAVEQQQPDSSWLNRSSFFHAHFVPATSSSRVIAISGSGAGAPPAGLYRVRPASLVCAGVTGNPAVVWPATGGTPAGTGYLFRIDAGGGGPPACSCDWNHDGSTSVADIFAFLGSWFAHQPAADFDHNGLYTVSDIFAFLGCWFARGGC